MPYTKGQRVCLWQVERSADQPLLLRVLKTVIVTITDTKFGAPGEFSGRPTTTMQSLRGTGDDDKVYEKHWNTWPESQTTDFVDTWTPRSDGAGPDPFWIPQEAVYVYGRYLNARRRGTPLTLEGTTPEERPRPQGDVVYCAPHDYYSHPGEHCFLCYLEQAQHCQV